MIPLYNSKGIQRGWAKTKADEELKDCDAIYISFAGQRFPVWKYIEMYCPILDYRGKKAPFMLNTAQIATYKIWDEQMRELGYIRCNEGKGRQMGSSTLISALYWVLCITNPGYRVAILADTEEKGKGLLRKYKFFYHNTPPELKADLEKYCISDNASDLEFDFGNGVISGIKVIVANENAGASYTFQAIHASEVALWDNIDATLMALEQTVADEPGTCIIRETTARGPNAWKNFYETGKNNRSEFKSIFLGWFLDDRYSKTYDGHELNEYERFLRDTVGIGLNKIQWWYSKWRKTHEDYFYMKQEFPSTESEMWQTTSKAKYDADIIAKRKAETEGVWLFRGHFECSAIRQSDPVEEDVLASELVIDNPRMIRDDFGPVKIFVEPIEGHPYAISCDPSEQGDDYYAVHVFDNSTGVQVATYHESKIDSDSAIKQIAMLGFYYGCCGIDKEKSYSSDSLRNRVYFASERQGGGTTVNRQIKRFGFNVRVDKSEDENGRYLAKYGWRTNPSNRPSMVDESSIAFKETSGRNINDYDTLVEMETFVHFGGKWQASKGNHDDLVMAYAGYFYCRSDYEANVEKPLPPKAKIPWDPCRSNKRTAGSTHFVDW